MIRIYDENTYKHSDNICLSCEYGICGDCKLLNTNINTSTNTNKGDIKNGESDTVQ